MKYELKVTQCQVGRFHFGSSEKTLSFYMGVYCDGKLVEEDANKAQLHFSGDEDELSFFEDAIENIEEVFNKCMAYSSKVWSTSNYRANCLLFAKSYLQNLYELDSTMVAAEKLKI